jgi:Ribose/xylose/arabinose/galactoside ABC-type transport systems, permease components
VAKETLTEQMALGDLPPADEKPQPKKSSWLVWAAENGIFVFTALLVLFAVFFVDGFASLINIADVLHRAAPLGIVAVGMTFVVISGNYLDLSVVAQIATSAVIFIAVSNEYGIPLAMLVALGAALLYCIVNDVAVGYFMANA